MFITQFRAKVKSHFKNHEQIRNSIQSIQTYKTVNALKISFVIIKIKLYGNTKIKIWTPADSAKLLMGTQ